MVNLDPFNYIIIRLQDNADIDTKFAINMSLTLKKNEISQIFVQFQFLHFNAEHGKSIAVLDEISQCPETTAKNCTVQCLNCKGRVRAFQFSG